MSLNTFMDRIMKFMIGFVGMACILTLFICIATVAIKVGEAFYWLPIYYQYLISIFFTFCLMVGGYNAAT